MAASREEVYERVKQVLTQQLGVEESEITEEASFQEDLDADSLDLVALSAALPPERAASAFTHTSWAEERSRSYERLEFLGDSVLELALAHELYHPFPDFHEGQMAKIRSHV